MCRHSIRLCSNDTMWHFSNIATGLEERRSSMVDGKSLVYPTKKRSKLEEKTCTLLTHTKRPPQHSIWKSPTTTQHTLLDYQMHSSPCNPATRVVKATLIIELFFFPQFPKQNCQSGLNRAVMVLVCGICTYHHHLISYFPSTAEDQAHLR